MFYIIILTCLLLSCSCSAIGIFHLFNLCLSDVIDADRVNFRRRFVSLNACQIYLLSAVRSMMTVYGDLCALNKMFAVLSRQPISSMVFGTNALITKPAASLAPIITVAFLSRYGYVRKPPTVGDLATVATVAVGSELVAAMVAIVSVTTIILGSVQFFIWLAYRPPK